MKNLLLLAIFILFITPSHSFAADNADQGVAGTLGDIFLITNTEVNGTDFPCGATTTIGIVSIAGTTYTLEDIYVDTQTNSATPYHVDATITDLTGPGGTLSTSIAPSSISTGGSPGPYHVGPYTPEVIVPVGTLGGTYTGTVTFTASTI